MSDSKSCTEYVDSSSLSVDENPTQNDDNVVEAPIESYQEPPEHVDSSSSSVDENPTQNDDNVVEAPVEPIQEPPEHADSGIQPVQVMFQSTPNSTQANVDDSPAETLAGAQENRTNELRDSAESLFHDPDARALVRLPPAAEPEQTLLGEPQKPQDLAAPQSQGVDVPPKEAAPPPRPSAAKKPQCPPNGQQHSLNGQLFNKSMSKAIARALDSTPERTPSHTHGRTLSSMLGSTFNSRT
ncbi:hypothetical protein ACHAPS_008464 [Verticillium nonalfalfae]